MLLLVSALLATAVDITPVQRVVQLLVRMKETATQEKHDELVQFSTYKQFCEDTNGHKQQSIKESNRRIDTLRATVTKNAADAKRLGAEVSAHEDDISVFEGDKQASSQVRDIEHVDFTNLQTDYSESIDALERAISVLKAQNYDRHQATALLLDLPLPVKSQRVIKAFLAQDPDDAHLNVEAPQAHGYEFQSQGVVQLLGELRKKFDTEREAARTKEANDKHAYEQLSHDLANQIDESSRQRSQKAEARGARLQAKGDASRELTDTVASRDDDQKYLTDLVATCEQKAADFEKRQQLRSDEIAAIGKAVAILSSDAVAGTANRQAAASFLQLHSKRFLNIRGDQRQRVKQFLEDTADRIHSRVLASMANRVSVDPLGKVKKMIRDLIVRLLDEATQSTDKNAWCEEELAQNNHTRSTKTSQVELLQANVDKLSASISSHTEDISELNEQVNALNKALTEALDMRSKEKAKNDATLKDAHDAHLAVARAIAVLKEFYAGAGKSAALVQQPFSEMPNPNPNLRTGEPSPAIFDSPYQGMQAEGGGIVGILEMILSDFARLETDTTASEAQAQKEHQQFLDDSEIDKTQKLKDIEHKTANKEDERQLLSEAEQDLLGTQKELKAARAYFDELKPQCVESGTSYEERTSRRQEEIESLQEALRLLNSE